MAWAIENSYCDGIISLYFDLADKILSGETLPLAYPPGYPLLLATLKIFGFSDYTSIRCLQALIDSTSCVALVVLLRRLNVKRTLALMAGMLYACLFSFIFASGMLLAEWLSPSIFIWFILLMVLYKQSFNVVWALLAGGTCGRGHALSPGFAPSSVLGRRLVDAVWGISQE